MALGRSEIGIVLLFCSFLFALFLSNSLVWLLNSLGFISSLSISIIVSGLTFALEFSGLALYILGRKEFLDRLRQQRGIVGLLVALGIVMVTFGFLFSSLAFHLYQKEATNCQLWPNMPKCEWSPITHLWSFVMFGLWFVFGLMWLADGLNFVAKASTSDS